MTRFLRHPCVGLGLLAAAFVAPAAAVAAPRPLTLSNGEVTARFDERGLVSLAGAGAGAPFGFRQDGFAITLDGTAIDSGALPAPSRAASGDRVTYGWTAGPWRLEAVYELRPGWRFVSKQLRVTAGPSARYRVDEITVLRATLAEPVTGAFFPRSVSPALGTGDYGAALRFVHERGLLAVVQNPFLVSTSEAGVLTIRYRPEMEWRAADGAFVADRGLLAPYRLSGRLLPAKMLPEWTLGPGDGEAGMDEAEVAAFTAMVRAFLLYRPERPLDIFVGWCANDYQIDVATPEGRAEYKRLIDRAAELGAEHVLYAPTHSGLSRRVESADDWSWENLLWLGLGQKIRKQEWDPRADEVPASVREMLDHARSRGVGLVAYVYPVVPFSQNPEWLATASNRPGRKYASLGVRSLQDWLIDTLLAFRARTGVSGYAFDHTFLRFDGTSRYAQWWGWRRVMEELRRRAPDVVIDGRQAYHLYGPWSWLAGSYPHPTFNDEQPESFVPFPDLHFDRVSAARERYTAYRYRNYEFAPSEIVPGFITHQTSRSDDTGDMPQVKTDRDVVLTRFRARDWDLLGWRYSLLSSIAIAGWNNVINMIPARDDEEFRHFSGADRQWFRRWIDWAAEHREHLRRTRTILGQPALGKIDGTSAIVGDRGYLFLFNPNARRLEATFTLDDTIGLGRPGRYLLKELHPLEGRLVGKPGECTWAHGDRVTLTLDGGSALVLELEPAPGAVDEPRLFNAPGTAALDGGVLRLAGVRGEAGTTVELGVQLPQAGGASVTGVSVNGREVAFSRTSAGTIVVPVRFDGAAFRQLQPVGDYDPGFAGGTLRAGFTVPARVFEQLAARAKAWPIPWTAEDYRTTWLAPERLLLFVQIAEPDPRWEARLRIDGRPVELRKAYSAVRAAPRTFVGFYADVSLVEADRTHTLELELPPLRPGQFQGVFFENVEPAYTDRVSGASR